MLNQYKQSGDLLAHIDTDKLHQRATDIVSTTDSVQLRKAYIAIAHDYRRRYELLPDEEVYQLLLLLRRAQPHQIGILRPLVEYRLSELNGWYDLDHEDTTIDDWIKEIRARLEGRKW